MTPDQAIFVLENIINATLKAGLFQNIADFQTAVDALNTLKTQSGVSVFAPNYTSTNTSEIKSLDHGVEDAKNAK